MNFRELLGDDSIVAVSTPPGEGAVGIVRLSGSESFSIAEKISRLKCGKKVSELSSHTMFLGHIMDTETRDVVDEVFVVPMKAPRTYTGQDMVEIYAHGAPVVLWKIMQLCVQHGARCASPGEFTKRAFLSGRMDLSQAEAVLDVIQAKNERALAAASSFLSGKLKGKIKDVREKLLSLLARVEVVFDYPEEGIEDISLDVLLSELERTSSELENLCATYEEGKKIKEGFRTVLAGKSNAGKSSLLNALVQKDRAIVTDIPGTTHDTLEEEVHLCGLPVTLVDTAGLRRNAKNAVEKMGIARTKNAVKGADIVLLVFDLSAPLNKDEEVLIREMPLKEKIVVFNKKDLKKKLGTAKILSLFNGTPHVETSAVTGDGLDELKETLVLLLQKGKGMASDEEVVLTNVRHKNALEKGCAHLKEALRNARGNMPMDVLTADIRGCLSALDEVTGEGVSPDILSEIFSRFCVGK